MTHTTYGIKEEERQLELHQHITIKMILGTGLYTTEFIETLTSLQLKQVTQIKWTLLYMTH